MTPLTRRDVLAHQAAVPWASQRQVEQDLLLCRAMAALFNDTFLRLEGSDAGRAEFIGILDSHLADRGFCTDMAQLLRVGAVYDPRKAGDYVKARLLSLLPGTEQ